MKKQSSDRVLKFIRQLPGGNVPQYAKLLGTHPIRINAILNTSEGQKLVRANLVRAPERGRVPDWASPKTVRGALRAHDVDAMHRNGTLPTFVTKELDKISPDFQDDALNYLREALEQSSNHTSFERQITNHMSQNRHYAEELSDTRLSLEQARNDLAEFKEIAAGFRVALGDMRALKEGRELVLTHYSEEAVSV